MNLKTWFKGLLVFVVSSFITSLAAANLSPSTFNFTKAGLAKMGMLALIIGIKAVFLYLKQSPLQSPVQTQQQASIRPGSGVWAIACLLVIPCLARAQAPAPSPTPEYQLANIYAAGVSYNAGASPEIAGTALYAHELPDGSTYAFTVVDALPISVKPFTVNTNFGVGVAQRIVSLGKVPIFIPTSAGISYNGNNTGWSWSTGAMASIAIKGNWRIFPNVRVQKSSVGAGAGYQPIVGVLFGWGQ